MPTYEYLCKTCGHRFETWQKMSDEPLTVCPNCGSPIHRVLFPTGVVFKGSGFYSTETRAQPGATGSSESPSPAASANGASDGKDTPAKADAPAASSSTASTDSGAKASASKDS
jgi:putative FmdB family regulatory protein